MNGNVLVEQVTQGTSVTPRDSVGQPVSFRTVLYYFYLFLLFLLFTTGSTLKLSSNTFLIHLAGLNNPLILLIILWLIWHAGHRFSQFPKLKTGWLLLGMLAVTMVSMLFSTTPYDFTEASGQPPHVGLQWGYFRDLVVYMGFFAITIDLIRTKGQLRHIINIIIASGILVVSFNVTYLAQNYFCSLGVLERYPFWTGKTPLGYYNSFLISFILGMLINGYSRGRWMIKVLITTLMGAAAVSLFFSFSRTSWLTIAVVILIAGYVKYRKWFLLCLLISLIVVAIAFQGMVAKVGLAVYHINTGNVIDRLNLWRSALNMFRDHPLLGVGPDTFKYNYLASYQLVDSSRWNSSYHAHNIFLHLAAEQGLAGLLLFLLFWGVIVKIMYQNFKETPLHSPLLRGLNYALLFALINYFLWSLTNTSLSSVTKSFYNINVMTWFFAAMVIIVAKIRNSEMTECTTSMLCSPQKMEGVNGSPSEKSA